MAGCLLPCSACRRRWRCTGSRVGVVDNAARLALRDRHVQGVEHDVGLEAGRHRPADDSPAPDIEDDGEVEESGPRRHVGDVRDPELVRAGGREVATDQVVGWTTCRITDRRECRLARRDADEPGLTHESGDALLADFTPSARARRAGAAHRTSRAIRRALPRASRRARGPASRASRAVGRPTRRTARRDAEQSAHGPDAMHGLVRLHEPERFGGVRFDSCADQAAYFFRISRSSRSVRFSRRRLASSSRSSVVSPSVRLPASRSAWRTQFRIAWAVGSKSSARLSGVRPALTNSTSGA